MLSSEISVFIPQAIFICLMAFSIGLAIGSVLRLLVDRGEK